MENIITKQKSIKTKRLTIPVDVEEIEIEGLDIPRHIKLIGFDRHRNKKEYCMRVTTKGKVSVS